MSLMPPRERSRRRAASRGVWLIVAALGVAFLAPAARLLGVTAAPLFWMERGVKSAAAPLVDYLSSKRALAEENRALRESVERLHVASLERDALAAERDTLAAELRVPSRPASAVVAEVLARPPQIAFDSVLLGAGTDDGVHVGDVVSSQGAPVGVIVSAGEGSAVASLFSAPGSRLSVSVGGSTAEAVGRGDGRFSVELPLPLSPATGTAVLSLAHRSAPIGYVAAISPGESEATVEARVALPVNLAAARFLTVLASPREE